MKTFTMARRSPGAVRAWAPCQVLPCQITTEPAGASTVWTASCSATTSGTSSTVGPRPKRWLPGTKHSAPSSFE